jgi:hypothetical protein
MATMALPITELGPMVVEARADAKSVVCYSKAAVADFSVWWHVKAGTFRLRKRFSALSLKQGKFIQTLLEQNLSEGSPDDLTKLATSLDELVTSERVLLDMSYSLGSEIRFWWDKSLAKLSEQVEHLDSVIESLRLAADLEGTALMAMAAEELVAVAVEQRQLIAQ